MRIVLASLFFSTLVAASISTRAAESDHRPEVVRLAITPAVDPKPALKYQLLPAFYDRRPGNAALDYGRAIASLSQLRGPALEFETEWNKWLDLPLDELEKTIQGRDLASLRETGALELARLGARCTRCDWQLPIREQPFYMILLPQLQEMRRVARYVALNVRLNVLEGKYDEAVRLLQVGYALARHSADEPTLVSGLVGVSIAAMMDRARLDLLQRRDAPSLFNAETFMPRPLVDPRPGIEAEMYALPFSFAALRSDERTPEQWTADAQELLRKLPELMAMASDEAGSAAHWAGLLSYVGVMAKVAFRRDELRAFVVSCGEPAGAVEKMNDSQLLLTYVRLQYDELRDDMFLKMFPPYAEVRPQIEAAEQRLATMKKDSTEIIPLASSILPTVSSLAHTYARSQRRRDVLQILEALRIHLAKHDGRLPRSLDELAGFPVAKIDAVTGKPFAYALDADKARLTLPEENRSTKTELIYEIRAAK